MTWPVPSGAMPTGEEESHDCHPEQAGPACFRHRGRARPDRVQRRHQSLCQRGRAAAPVTVTLTLGVPDSPGFPPEFQDVVIFARQVRQISGGRMKIRIMWEVTQVTNPEPATVSLVRDGKVDLGWIGARAWDTLGVRSFQALQAPFLIDSYPLLDAVLASPMAGRMLAGLHQAGFTGLGLYPDQLRHLNGSASHWRPGGTCGAPGSGSRHHGPPTRCSARWARCQCA